nr:methionine ABC transporter permease [uncultured Rhodopila sp.]
MYSNWPDLFLPALRETLEMTAAAGAIAFLAGLPLGLVLAATAPGGIWEQRWLNRILGVIVNAFCAVPFIVLLVALIPLTRLIAGTSIGTEAAIVPLAIGATPYYARIAEVSFRDVDHGLIEAVKSMGGNGWTIVLDVLVPEALPGLLAGFTATIVTMIGGSAMAGAIGGGGLGDLAIRHGYQRFDTGIMAGVIVVLIALVSIVQLGGDRLARRFDHR